MSTAKHSKIAEFLRLQSSEREAVAREFGKEFIGETFRPLSLSERKAWIRAKRRMKRTKVAPVKRVTLNVRRDLLSKSDAYARQLGITRSQLVSLGLEKVLADRSS